jgi:hypothetical protein
MQVDIDSHYGPPNYYIDKLLELGPVWHIGYSCLPYSCCTSVIVYPLFYNYALCFNLLVARESNAHTVGFSDAPPV